MGICLRPNSTVNRLLSQRHRISTYRLPFANFIAAGDWRNRHINQMPTIDPNRPPVTIIEPEELSNGQ